MTRLWTHGCWLLLTLAGGAVFVVARAGFGYEEPVRPPCKNPLTPRALEPLVQDASACSNCHVKGPPESKILKALCRCTEQTFWEHNDKHADAYVVLDDPRSVKICKNLNANPPKENLECLGCHSIAFINPKKPLGEIDKANFDQGVSCLACHGAWDNWKFPHGETDPGKRACWRNLDRKNKDNEWGMTDLWDPEKRTQVCASCHIGDPDPAVHRFVTHVMYAAGHPPLPAFETAAFCDGLPRHWQLMSEKTPEMQKQDYGWDPRELEQTKLAVVGEAAAFREAVNLLAKKTAGKDELDFALFDCSACHHDLKQPSWRQAAGYEGPPGRPGLRRWSPAGLELCLWYAGDTDEDRKALREEYTARMSDLRSAFTSRPYGDAALVGKAGAALVAWADGKLIPGLTRPNGGGTRYDAKGALRLLKRLAQMAADPGPGQTPDYDGARQTAWTFRAIYDDVSCALNRSPDDPETAGAAKVLDENGKAIHAQLHRLDELLNLDLPNAKGIPRDVDNDAAKKMRMAQLQAFLPCVLGHEADYDPDAVKTAFAELAKLLP